MTYKMDGLVSDIYLTFHLVVSKTFLPPWLLGYDNYLFFTLFNQVGFKPLLEEIFLSTLSCSKSWKPRPFIYREMNYRSKE